MYRTSKTLFALSERKNPLILTANKYQQIIEFPGSIYLLVSAQFLKAFSRKPVLFTWFDPELPHGRVAHHPGHSVGDHAAFVREPVPVVPLVRPQRLVQCRLGPVPEVFIRSDLEAMSMKFFH